jgi:hypothetical protein
MARLVDPGLLWLPSLACAQKPSQRVAEKISLRPEKHAMVHGGRDAIIYAASLGPS